MKRVFDDFDRHISPEEVDKCVLCIMKLKHSGVNDTQM